MKADEMALECARQIQEYCEVQEECDGCALHIDGYCVACGEEAPRTWPIPSRIGSGIVDDGK